MWQAPASANVLGDRALLPVMLMETINRFAPAGHRPVRACCILLTQTPQWRL